MTKIHTKLCSCNLFRKPNIFSIWNNKEIIGKSYRSPSGPGENTYMARNSTSSALPLRPIFRLWFLMMASPTYNDHLDYFSINGFYGTLQVCLSIYQSKPFLEKLFEILNSFIAQGFFVNSFFKFCFGSIWRNLLWWLSRRKWFDRWSDLGKHALVSGLFM